MKFSTIFWLIILALGLTLFVIGGVGDTGPQPTGDVTPTPTVTVTPTSTIKPTPTSAIKPTPTPDNRTPFDDFPDQGLAPTSVPQSELTGPATCNLSGGKIRYLDANTAINEGAFISYTNVDDPARLIFWESSPSNDGALSIGPNIFSGLALPDGQHNVGATPDKERSASKYVLTAKINYGIFDVGGGVIRTEIVACSGIITVEFN